MTATSFTASTGKLGTTTEATTYNWYTGPVDYIGIIPDKDYFTKYSLDSPNGLYNVHNSELVPVHGSSVNVNVAANKVLEGNAPVIQDRGREVEVDVSGKVLVQLDESRLGSGVTIGVDTDAVTAQVVTSPNDLINTEYRDFNGTGKFVFFDGAAQLEPHGWVSFGLNGPDGTPTRWRCLDDRYPNDIFDTCRVYLIDSHGHAELYSSGSYSKSYNLYADHQPPIPHMLDAYLSDVEESLVHSNTTTSVTHAYLAGSHVIRELKTPYDSSYLINSTFVDRLWHVTGLAEQAIFTIVENFDHNGYRPSGWTQGIVGATGTHVVADATPYVFHGSVEPFSSESIPTTTDSNVYVLLEGIGKDQTYTVSDVVEDATPPAVLSIERHNPSGLATNSDMLVYKVTFSEDVFGVDVDDFVLTPDSTSGMNVSLATYHGPSVGFTTHSSGSGTITVTEDSTDMLVAVEFDFSHRSTSLALRAPDGSSQAIPSGQNTLHVLDFGSGSVTGDWSLYANRNSYGSGTVTDWSLTVLTGNATSPVTAVSGSGSEYYVTVPASRAGTYGIGLGSNPHITDAAGNLLSDRVPTSNVDRLYSVAGMTDVTAPVVSSIERSNPTVQNTNSQTLTYEVTFSEAVTGVDAFDFVFSPDSTGGGNSGSYPVTSISGSGDTYHVTVPADTDGTYNLDLSPGHGIADAASNPLTDTVPATGIDHTYVSTSGRGQHASKPSCR